MSITKATNSGLVGTKYNNVSADNYYMEPIYTTLLPSTVSTFTFSNIPQGYKHLQIRCLVRMNRADTADNMSIQFNGDTGSNYSFHDIRGDGSGAYAEAGSSISAMYIPDLFATSPNANFFSPVITDILDYRSTDKFKTIRSLSGYNTNSSPGAAAFSSGNWRNTAPITSITFGSRYGSGLISGSRFSLYGIRG